MLNRHGTLIIPTLRICVPLYEGADLQGIVDAPDSAVFFRLGVQDCIADHCHQEGFSRLAGAVPKKTMARIVTQNRAIEYICIRNEIGRLVTDESGHHLRDANMNPVYKQNDGGLCIYTCTGKTEEAITYVHLTYWRPVNSITNRKFK